MECNILLVGLGNIGKRYLEGIVKVNFVRSIYIIEKKKTLIDKFKTNYADKYPSKKFFLTNSIEKISCSDFFVTFICTTAVKRYELLLSIKSKINSSFYIIEKVLAQSEKELMDIKKLFKNHAGAWISSPRRSMAWYKDIKNYVYEQKNLNFTVDGYNWGMACNSIHFIDLVSWTTGEKIVDIDISGLNKLWIKSKRKGFWEITGVMKVIFSNQVSLTMKCKSDGLNVKSYNIFIINKNLSLEINEQEGLAKLNNCKKINGSFLYLSNIIPEMIKNLFKNGDCDWIKLDESINMHQKLINSLTSHWNENSNHLSEVLPIT